MPRGGARPGAGRPKNRRNNETIAQIAKVEATGDAPLDVMLFAMRTAFAMAQGALGAEKLKPRVVIGALQAAHEFAKDAAPYVHSKLAPVNADGEPEPANVTNNYNITAEKVAVFMQMPPLERARRMLFALELAAREHEQSQAAAKAPAVIEGQPA